MATKSEISAQMLPKLKEEELADFTWADVETVVTGATTVEEAAILSAIQDENVSLIGTRILALVDAEVTSRATAQATSMLADDALDLDELDYLL
jgi:hypothetical protein